MQIIGKWEWDRIAVMVGLAFLAWVWMLFRYELKSPSEPVLLHVSFDATRELYQRLNPIFIETYRQQTGQGVIIRQSHGGSASQARALMDGIPGDVVSLGLIADMDILAKKARLFPSDWQQRLPNHSCPASSTIVFLVRKNNPKKVYDWSDLTKDSIEIIAANPATGGAGKLSMLAAWGANWQQTHDRNQADQFVRTLIKHVPVLDSSSRSASITFSQHATGDVLITWENEAIQLVRELKSELEIVYPSSGSLVTDLPVTWIEHPSLEAKSSLDSTLHLTIAIAYTQFLFEEVAQRVFAECGYRPYRKELWPEYISAAANSLPLFRMSDCGFSTDSEVQDYFFSTNGLIEKIMTQD